MSKIKNLINNRYGRWTVIGEDTTGNGRSNRTSRRWLCRCDCGTERYVLERSLIYGGSKSCGCASVENSIKATSYELAGQQFGDLTVLYKAVDHPKDTRGGIWWRCRCSCGTECDVLASLLVTGRKTHCGCKTKPNYHFENIEGKTFGKLTAKYPLATRDKKGGVIWHCACACGNEVDIPYNWLVYSNVCSCGCQKKEHNEKMQSYLTRVDGTSIDMIRSKKIPIDNTTGIKGVYRHNGKWMAKIVFQKKQYHLGHYQSIDGAIKARRSAETALFDNVLGYYEHWKAKAISNPNWAKNNPIKVTVEKVDNELKVMISPILDEKETSNA